MRRGRPTKGDGSPASASASTTTTNNNFSTNENTFDPFDPSHVSKSNTPQRPSSSSPSSSPSLPVSSSSPPPPPPAAAFQNSFTPENVGTPTRVQSAPVTHHVTPKPQMATKILQTQPSSPVKPAAEPVAAEEVNNELPKINRTVSSSIEARFMAIKNASRNSNSTSPPAAVNPTASTSSTKKNKPTPPPKPARFRSAAKVVLPTVDDFENKFPSLEELDKSIS